MNADEATAPLLGLFRALRAQGVPLGTRDYLDALRALEAGFGADRDALRRLAQQLWARSDEERRTVALWFEATAAEVAPLAEAVAALLAPAGPEGTTPLEPGPQRDGARRGRAGVPGPAPAPAPAPAEPQPRGQGAFAARRDDGGVPLPVLRSELAITEDYVLQPAVSPGIRELAVLWRRYRRGTRRGPRTELDLPASIRERCRRGMLAEPVLRARRGNSARLLVLADTSPSMEPWFAWLQALEDSLQFARFASAEMRYFSNLPRRELFGTPTLARPEPAEQLLRRHAGAALLVVSDAGSARGFLNRRRAVQTAAFLAEAGRQFGACLWINPMPRERWAGSTAALVARSPALTMLPLDAQQLLRGIDILRGNK